jgi:competence protein ComEC
MAPLPVESLSPGAYMAGWSDGIRQWILDGLRHCLDGPEMDALSGMLFHQNDHITDGVRDDLQQTGTIHIIATAGLHVGIFMAVCLFVLRWLFPRRTVIVLTMLLLVGYSIACGAHPAVVRATSVAELCLLAPLLGRLPDSLTCLCLAAALMVLLGPNALLDSGFQFTFATVGVILLVMPLWVRQQDADRSESLRSRIVHHAKSIAALSAAAQLGSWPLTAYDFNIISYAGFFANAGSLRCAPTRRRRRIPGR